MQQIMVTSDKLRKVVWILFLCILECIVGSPILLCHTNPCQNNGTCLRISDLTMVSYCPGGYEPWDGQCYKFFANIQSWNDATQTCDSEYAKLVSIETEDEWNYIEFVIQRSRYKNESLWTSGQKGVSSQDPDKWIWTATGVPMDLTNWSNNSAGAGNCLEISKEENYETISPESCNSKNSFLCELPEPDALQNQLNYSYECLCQSGYKGVHCEKSYNPEPGDESGVSDVHFFCEHEKFSIFCSEDMFLNFDYAAYGYLTAAPVCQFAVQWVDCMAPNSLSLIRQRCQGRQKCVFQEAITTWFNYNPCPGTFKNLMLRFQCRNDVKKCPAGSTYYNESCFEALISYATTWGDAQVSCRAKGGDLASIDNNATEAFLMSLVKNSQFVDYTSAMFWIALKRDDNVNGDNSFAWTDGSTSSYRNWKSGWVDHEGPEACGYLVPVQVQEEYIYVWDSHNCSAKFYWMCRYPPFANEPPRLSIVPEETTTPEPGEVTTTEPGGVTTTEPLKTTTATVQPEEICQEAEARGITFPTTPFGEVAVQPCPEGTSGNATWYCDKDFGQFSPDGPDLSSCKQPWVDEVEVMVDSGAPAVETASVLSTHTSTTTVMYGGDIIGSVTCLEKLVIMQSDEVSDTPTEDQRESMDAFTKDVCLTSSNVLAEQFEEGWTDIPKDLRTQTALQMTNSLNKNAFLLADYMEEEEIETLVYYNILMQVNVHNNTEKDLVFPDPYAETETVHFKGSNSSHVVLSKHALAEIHGDGSVKGVFFFYNNLESLLPARIQNSTETLTHESLVLSASLDDEHMPVYFEENEFIFTLELYASSLNDSETLKHVCSYWNESDGGFWNQNGCKEVFSNETHATCTCNHMTSFTVLMDTQGDTQISETHQLVLDVVTYIGCCISIVCLFICVIVFTVFRNLWCDRITIHRNLCLTLLIAELLFVVGIDQTKNKVFCSIVAALLHYFFLSAFAWMCLEGIELYIMLIKVFESETQIRWFYLFGYGLPMLVVVVAAAVQPDGYGTEKYCWLNTETNFIYSFIAPVCLVILVNMVCLVVALKVVFSVKSNPATAMGKQSKYDKIRGWLKGSVMLLSLLGITWIFGLLYINEETIVFAYLFTIFNSFQGFFIFIFHCVMNEKVQKSLARFIQHSSCCPQSIKKKVEHIGTPSAVYTSSSGKPTSSTYIKNDSKSSRLSLLDAASKKIRKRMNHKNGNGTNGLNTAHDSQSGNHTSRIEGVSHSDSSEITCQPEVTMQHCDTPSENIVDDQCMLAPKDEHLPTDRTICLQLSHDDLSNSSSA